METLSPSKTNTMLACNRHYYWRYELGLEQIEKAQPLRFGSAFHRALAARANKADYETALKAGIGETKELEEMDIAILAALLSGYYATYQTEIIQTMHPEIEIIVPMQGNRSFQAHCILDGLATLNDNRLAIVEHKTTSESLDPDSGFWDNLRFNVQVFGYWEAAKFAKWEVSTVLYDVIKKPGIRQKKDETVEQFADRLKKDVQERPEFYFARRELPVLDQDVQEYQAMRDCVARQITNQRKEQKRYEKPEMAWPRCVGRFTCQSCDCSHFCLQNISASKDNIPSGMKIKEIK